MNEAKQVKIPLESFEQRAFVDWLRKQRSNEYFPREFLGIATSLPYTLALQKLESFYRRFILHVVNEAIGAGNWQIDSFEIAKNKFEVKENFSEELAQKLLFTLEHEYGISGMVPHRFASFTLAEISKGTKQLLYQIRRNREQVEIASRHSGRVSSQVIRTACLVCREFENLTNLLLEMLCYITLKSLDELLGEEKDSWYGRINQLAKFPYNPELSDIYSLLVEDDSLINMLHQIRKIRNKIAHPLDVQIEHIEQLIDLSEGIYGKIRFNFPMLARIVGIQVCASGAVQISFYLESDRRKMQPTTVVYEDILGIQQNIGESDLGKEIIVFPMSFIRNKYKLVNEIPLVLLRKQDIIEEIYDISKLSISLVVNYTEMKEEV